MSAFLVIYLLAGYLLFLEAITSDHPPCVMVAVLAAVGYLTAWPVILLFHGGRR